MTEERERERERGREEEERERERERERGREEEEEEEERERERERDASFTSGLKEEGLDQRGLMSAERAAQLHISTAGSAQSALSLQISAGCPHLPANPLRALHEVSFFFPGCPPLSLPRGLQARSERLPSPAALLRTLSPLSRESAAARATVLSPSRSSD